MSHNPSERLVYMANQIGKFFQSQGQEKEVAGVAEHIKKFWDPRMLKTIYAHHDAGGAGLDPAVKEAIGRLKDAAVAKEKA
ncbi:MULTISPECIES: formate dehydrogenase subunit delta [unclassified Bradyrhizobium]|uniref:formate dehydrogenase subunit delta n=1 Tax=Bradyrhizobium TaxID=374 RepID=UPI0028EB52B0|nr:MULTISPECIES: formate dehydrogenase subunit delta [unclassified Bradyrhizobium]